MEIDKKELIKQIKNMRFFGLDCQKPGFDDAIKRILEIINK